MCKLMMCLYGGSDLETCLPIRGWGQVLCMWWGPLVFGCQGYFAPVYGRVCCWIIVFLLSPF